MYQIRVPLVVTIFLLAITVAGIESAFAAPQLPYILYGTVNGTVPDGSLVRILGEGIVYSEDNPISVTAQKFGGPLASDRKVLVQGNLTEGQELLIYIDASQAQVWNGTGWNDFLYFHEGKVEEIVIRAKQNESPTPTPSPTWTYHFYPSGGGGGGGGGSTTMITTKTTSPTPTSTPTPKVTPTTSVPTMATFQVPSTMPPITPKPDVIPSQEGEWTSLFNNLYVQIGTIAAVSAAIIIWLVKHRGR